MKDNWKKINFKITVKKRYKKILSDYCRDAQLWHYDVVQGKCMKKVHSQSLTIAIRKEESCHDLRSLAESE